MAVGGQRSLKTELYKSFSDSHPWKCKLPQHWCDSIITGVAKKYLTADKKRGDRESWRIIFKLCHSFGNYLSLLLARGAGLLVNQGIDSWNSVCCWISCWSIWNPWQMNLKPSIVELCCQMQRLQVCCNAMAGFEEDIGIGSLWLNLDILMLHSPNWKSVQQFPIKLPAP